MIALLAAASRRGAGGAPPRTPPSGPPMCSTSSAARQRHPGRDHQRPDAVGRTVPLTTAYMAAGAGLTHTEQRGSPGYSAAGAYAAANAVLSQGSGWDGRQPVRRRTAAPRPAARAAAADDRQRRPRRLQLHDDLPRLDPRRSAGAHDRHLPRRRRDDRAGGGRRRAAVHPRRSRRPCPAGPYRPGTDRARRRSRARRPRTTRRRSAARPSPARRCRWRCAPSTATPRCPAGGTLGPYLSPGGFIIPERPLQPARRLPRPRRRRFRRGADAPRLELHRRRRRIPTATCT